jgi:DNA-binding NarL/FixJ family response regulator
MSTRREARGGTAEPITVLLAEDHAVVREGLKSLLAAESDIVVIAEAQNGRQAVEKTKALRPAVVVMDIAMPLLNGLEATRQILKAFPGTRVLILSAHGDDEYVEQVVALGLPLPRQTNVGAGAGKAIREAGDTFFSPSILKRIGERAEVTVNGASGRKKKLDVRLTSRED